ncbi:MAG: glutamate--tRNA ligase [Mariprofundales bacterium]
MTTITTRFAPSPSGMLHIGNARTALLNAIFARQQQGRFILRFEDTDSSRIKDNYKEAIRTDLAWLGIKPDAEVAPQSARQTEHNHALQDLANNGHAYRCFCSASRLQLERKLAVSQGKPPRYAGHCRHLSTDEAAQRALNEPFVWRLAAHANSGSIIVHDLLRGDIVFSRADIDDPVLVRSNGDFTFLLPNAIDDAADKVSHVLRGDDHLSNTVWQIYLLQSLGHKPPVFAHHGLMLGEDGAKLSKRRGDLKLSDLREQGLLSESLVQSLVRIGHPNMPDNAHNIAELAKHLQVKSLSSTACRWQSEEMWRWHTRLLHQLLVKDLLILIRQFVPQANLEFATLIQPNLTHQRDARDYIRLLDVTHAPNINDMPILEQAGSEFFASSLIQWQKTECWSDFISQQKQASGLKGKRLFAPLRLALSGVLHGPNMQDLINYLGNEGVTKRLQDMQKRLSS